jgi:flagellar motor protein MotB
MKFRVMLLAPLALSALMMTGCSNKTAAERDSLQKQNQDLASQLEAEKAARAAAEARANAVPETPAATTPTAADSTPDMSAAGPTMGTPDMGSSMGTGIIRKKNARGEDTIQVSSDILFDSGKAALKPSAKKALDKVAAVLKKEYSGQELRVEGYTDPHPVKTSGWDDNWDLGAARARTVMLYLHTKGVRDMYIASFGDTKLKSTKNLAEDRRVEIVVVK